MKGDGEEKTKQNEFKKKKKLMGASLASHCLSGAFLVCFRV